MHVSGIASGDVSRPVAIRCGLFVSSSQPGCRGTTVCFSAATASVTRGREPDQRLRRAVEHGDVTRVRDDTRFGCRTAGGEPFTVRAWHHLVLRSVHDEDGNADGIRPEPPRPDGGEGVLEVSPLPCSMAWPATPASHDQLPPRAAMSASVKKAPMSSGQAASRCWASRGARTPRPASPGYRGCWRSCPQRFRRRAGSGRQPGGCQPR
jgi:hypothetical protein